MADTCERASIDEMYLDITSQVKARLATTTQAQLRACFARTCVVGKPPPPELSANLQASEGAAVDQSIQPTDQSTAASSGCSAR